MKSSILTLGGAIMKKISNFQLCFLIFIHMFGALFFYNGFFPNIMVSSSNNNGQKPERHNKDIKPLLPKYDKLIFILIDAIRADFILNLNVCNQTQHSTSPTCNMPFLQDRIMKNLTFSYISQGNSPTVTMPRIKGITSGSIPNFHDVLLNAASSEFLDDNIIQSFTRNGLKSVFYGDDTWIKLFPSSFIRFEGTQSFFVNDYTEVDNNVSRHLPEELDKSDWDVMILHYLGLDHIGHTAGPFSPLINKKLLEMDNIIKMIFQRMFDKMNNTKTLIVITGDHGMSNMGSHGGSSKEEINTPCIFLSTEDDFGEPFGNILIKQVDIAITLALLFGVDIPSKSIGKPLPLLYNLYQNSDLKIMEKKSAQHLCKVSINKLGIGENLVQNLCNNTGNQRENINRVSDKLSTLSSEYNERFLVLGLVFMATPLFLKIIWIITKFKSNLDRKIIVLILFVSVAALSSSSLVEEEHYLHYFFLPTFIVSLYLIKSVHMNNIVFILILLRICRGWSQTGVKWSGLPDIEDYMKENIGVLMSFIIAGFVATIFVFNDSKIRHLVYIVINFPLLYFKLCSCTTSLNYCSEITKLYSARIVYIEIFLLFLWSILVQRQNFVKMLWICFSILLIKPTIVPWFYILVILEYVVSQKLIPELISKKQLSSIITFYIYHGFAKFSFYAQGNSNNFATVDISAGMIGFTEYNPIVANILSFFATYCSKILWYISLKETLESEFVQNFAILFCWYQMFESTVFSFIVYLMRYHLFIWSVFAPKYLYMFVESTVNYLFVAPLLFYLCL